MADSNESKSRQEIIQEWLADEQARKREERKTHRHLEEPGGLTINSLMDAMTIILVFLLINYASDPLKTDYPDLQLPPSTTDISPEQSVAVVITQTSIVVSDRTVVEIKGGVVDKVHKGGEETGLQIVPLFEQLNKEAVNQKRLATNFGRNFEGLLTVIADKGTPYRILVEVLATASQAEFKKFKFAVLKGGRRGGLITKGG